VHALRLCADGQGLRVPLQARGTRLGERRAAVQNNQTKERPMRINVYSQELTDEVLLIEKGSNTGITYHAAQLVLHSSPLLHHPPHDDDRSAVTFWLPKSQSRREQMALAFERIAKIFREAPPSTGLD